MATALFVTFSHLALPECLFYIALGPDFFDPRTRNNISPGILCTLNLDGASRFGDDSITVPAEYKPTALLLH